MSKSPTIVHYHLTCDLARLWILEVVTSRLWWRYTASHPVSTIHSASSPPSSHTPQLSSWLLPYSAEWLLPRGCHSVFAVNSRLLCLSYTWPGKENHSPVFLCSVSSVNRRTSQNPSVAESRPDSGSSSHLILEHSEGIGSAVGRLFWYFSRHHRNSRQIIPKNLWWQWQSALFFVITHPKPGAVERGRTHLVVLRWFTLVWRGIIHQQCVCVCVCVEPVRRLNLTKCENWI